MLKRNIYICLTLLFLFSLFVHESFAQNVNIKFTATTKDKSADIKLNAEDIRVLVDGKAQPIVSLQKFDEQPFVLALMFDVSLSQEKILENTKIAGDEFVRTIARSDKDKLAAISFTGKINIEQSLTNNFEQVRQAIQSFKVIIPQGYIGNNKNVAIATPKDPQTTSGVTAIWDSLYYVSNNLSGETLSYNNKAIIIFTDGIDTSSKAKMKEAMAGIIQLGVRIYSIGIGDEFFGGVNRGSLQEITKKTGGLSFTPKKLSELPDIYKAIEQSLRSYYTLTFTPTYSSSEDKMRKFKIEIINPELRKRSLKINHDEGYFVVSEKK